MVDDQGKKPLWKKKKVWIPAVVVAVLIAASAGGGDDEDTASDDNADTAAETTTTTADDSLYPDRVDRQEEDQERAIGGSVELSGYTGTVNQAEFRQSISDFEKDGYIVVDVTVLNRDDRAQSYNYFDWKLQSPDGQVTDPTFTTIEGAVESGDLVKGGTVSGKIVFEVGDTKGDFYVIYKPDPFDAARGVWKLTV